MKLKMSVTSAIILVTAKSFLTTILRLLGKAPEIPSPKPRIGWKGFTYNPEMGTLTIHNLWKAYAISVQNTNSMDGLLDEGHIVFMSKDWELYELEVGEVVIYTKVKSRAERFQSYIQHKGKESIIHQLVFIGEDEEGWFAIPKGANCFFPDPIALREQDIVSVMRAIFY